MFAPDQTRGCVVRVGRPGALSCSGQWHVVGCHATCVSHRSLGRAWSVVHTQAEERAERSRRAKASGRPPAALQPGQLFGLWWGGERYTARARAVEGGRVHYALLGGTSDSEADSDGAESEWTDLESERIDLDDWLRTDVTAV